MDQLHLITVNESVETTLHASGAEFIIKIGGQSFFTGDEAFKKAAEVRECVDALKACGIEQDAITLQNISTEVESGLLTKTSSATYHLKVRCEDLDHLGPAISAIASQKNAQLSKLHWNYSKLEQTRANLLQTAVKQARTTAGKIAESLGTRCSAVHHLSYDYHGANQRGFVEAAMSALVENSKQRAAKTAPLQQMNLEHNTTLAVNVSAQFVVEPFSESV